MIEELLLARFTVLKKSARFNCRLFVADCWQVYRILFASSNKTCVTNGQMVGQTDGRKDGQTDGRMDGQTDEQTNGQTDKRTNGRKDGQMDRRTGGRTDGRTD